MASSQRQHYDVSNAKTLFEDFVKEHNREYKDEADRELHYQAFVANLEKINRLTDGNPHATYGINKFADYTEEDMKQMRGLRTGK